MLLTGSLYQAGKSPGLLLLADQGERVIQRIEPDFIGYGVAAQHAVADFS